jgi:hypothetical protein
LNQCFSFSHSLFYRLNWVSHEERTRGSIFSTRSLIGGTAFHAQSKLPVPVPQSGHTVSWQT